MTAAPHPFPPDYGAFADARARFFDLLRADTAMRGIGRPAGDDRASRGRPAPGMARSPARGATRRAVSTQRND